MSTLLGGYDSKNNVLTPKQSEQQSCKHQILLKENFLSEFFTKSEKQKVLQNLGINSTIEWGEIGGYIENQTDLLEKLKNYILKEANGDTATKSILYSNEAYPNISTLQQALDMALYQDLTINITAIPNIAELGDVLDDVLITWSYNKSNIKKQALDDEMIDESLRQITLKGPIVQTFTKKVTGNDGTKSVSGKVTVNFYPGIYFGIGKEQPGIDSMEKLLLPSRVCKLTINAPSSEYIWIFLPASYGEPIFTVGGFSGGFQKVGSTSYKVTNYNIWRSDNHSLGNTIINIS